MGANRAMNDRLRQGFGRQVEEDRKQSGVKDVADMTVKELVTENVVLTSRLADVGEELAARAEASEAEAEQEGSAE